MIEVSRKEVLEQNNLHQVETEEERRERLRRAKHYFASWQRAEDSPDGAQAEDSPDGAQSTAVIRGPPASCRAPRARGPVRRARRPRAPSTAVTGEMLS